MKLILYDINKDLIEAWKKEFKDLPNVEVLNIEFKDLQADYVVTAGNSLGVMTGGIDLAVREYYGQRIQDIIQNVMLFNRVSKLKIGYGYLLQTGDKLKPRLVYLPTMEYPEKIYPEQVYFIFASLLRQYDYLDDSRTFAVCGLGTCTGGIDPKDCAKMMRRAYDIIFGIRNEN